MQLFTVNGAAAALERDRRTVQRALRGVTPEGTDAQGREVWRLATIVEALQRHSGNRQNPDAAAIAEVEAAGKAVAALLEALRKEPNIERRRAIANERGNVIGAFDKALAAIGVPDGASGEMERRYRDHVLVGPAIRELMTLCRWQLA